MHCTIYLLRDNTNNMIYIGQTWLSLKKRFGPRGLGYKNSIYLYAAIQKHGHENFTYEVLDTCEDQETADLLEDNYITQYDSRNPDVGYNLKEGGSAGRHSNETREKMSKTMKNKTDKLSPEELANKVKYIVGYWEGKERGPHSEEWKEENSTRMTEWHENNVHPMLGKTHSEEAKIKISEASKGHPVSEEQRKAISKAHKMDPERERAIIAAYQNQTNISDIEKEFGTSRSSIYRILDRNNIPRAGNFTKWTGKKHSKETKEKQSDARKQFWEKK